MLLDRKLFGGFDGLDFVFVGVGYATGKVIEGTIFSSSDFGDLEALDFEDFLDDRDRFDRAERLERAERAEERDDCDEVPSSIS